MHGVKYTGPYMDHTGYAAANRAFITALHMAGVEVTTELVVQVKERSTFGWEGELCHQLQQRNIPYKVKILHTTPDIFDKYMEEGKYHISHLFWETDRLPTDWIKPLNKMGEIWTSSPHMVDLFKKSGVKVPIYWFPQPIDITCADRDYGQFVFPGHQGFTFYSIFQWIERKNPKALLESYWQAFAGRDDVSLIIKTWRLGYDESEFEKIRDDIRKWRNESGIPHTPRVALIKQLLSQEDMMKLHQSANCYVQVDRGEGWSRTIQEALLLGKPVISTARGGIHEHLKDHMYFRIPSAYVPVTEQNWIKYYTKEQNWADVDREKLKQAMQFAFKNPDLIGSRGKVARDYIREEFNYYKIGLKMKDRIEQIYKGL